MQRRTSLDAALRDIEAGTLVGVVRVVVSDRWWGGLPMAVRHEYQQRCLGSHVDLSIDDRMSLHYVELLDRLEGPPLSSERWA